MSYEQLSLFSNLPKEEIKKTKSRNIVNNEHLKEFVSIFQKTRIIGFTHDYQGDYKIIGSVLKNAKNYDYKKVKDMLLYFKKYGLKEIQGNIIGYLTWAFLNPEVAKQPYNTIDLNKQYNRGVNNVRKEKLLQRNRYEDRFKRISEKN